MAPESRGIKFTYQDYLLFPEDGKRHELINGDHCVTPAPTTRHQIVSGNLFGPLHIFVRRNKLGKVFSAPTDVVLSEPDVVQPDLLFVSASHADRITRSHVQGPPDLVIEILSHHTRRTDEIVKRKLYERFGVPEFWVVDPELESIKIYRMGPHGYERVAELSAEADDQASTPLLPGFQISLREIFE